MSQVLRIFRLSNQRQKLERTGFFLKDVKFLHKHGTSESFILLIVCDSRESFVFIER